LLDEPRQSKQDWELGEVRDGPPLDAVALHLLQHHVGVILHGVLGSSRPRSTWKASPYYCRCWSRRLPCPRTPLGGARTLLQPCVASAPRHHSGHHTKLLVVHPCCLILVRHGRRCRTRRTEMQDAGSHARHQQAGGCTCFVALPLPDPRTNAPPRGMLWRPATKRMACRAPPARSGHTSQDGGRGEWRSVAARQAKRGATR